MKFHIITLFPDSLSSYVNESIIGRAQREGHISISFYNPRDFVKAATKKADGFVPYKRVDDKSYGGGPGMVMQAEPLIKAIDKALDVIAKNIKSANKKRSLKKSNKTKIIFLTPSGKQFTNEYAKRAVEKFDHIILICGRYEGIDARVQQIFKAEEISVGPFVLTGGELGAMIIIDSMSRQIEGVLGNFTSLEESRISSPKVYTRPETILYNGKKYRVPKVLLSGDRAKIDEWKQKKQKMLQ
jgi:tRNA (guanine37-N1)-methyltransferase